jgi:surfactin synthase thioesterase subunit
LQTDKTLQSLSWVKLQSVRELFKIIGINAIIPVDLPGHGRRANVDGGLNEWCNEIIKILPNNPILLGWSLGGLLAINIAFIVQSSPIKPPTGTFSSWLVATRKRMIQVSCESSTTPESSTLTILPPMLFASSIFCSNVFAFFRLTRDLYHTFSCGYKPR